MYLKNFTTLFSIKEIATNSLLLIFCRTVVESCVAISHWLFAVEFEFWTTSFAILNLLSFFSIWSADGDTLDKCLLVFWNYDVLLDDKAFITWKCWLSGDNERNSVGVINSASGEFTISRIKSGMIRWHEIFNCIKDWLTYSVLGLHIISLSTLVKIEIKLFAAIESR